VQPRWVAGALVLLGVAGVAVAVTAMATALPAPAAGGTCGPGHSSETAFEAFFNPGSLGAGPEPAATQAAAHAQWLAFIGECQAATDARTLSALAVLVLAVLALVAGLLIWRHDRRRAAAAGPGDAGRTGGPGPERAGPGPESRPAVAPPVLPAGSAPPPEAGTEGPAPPAGDESTEVVPALPRTWLAAPLPKA
jgi:cytochrome bd-type quinol oxidase subunit 2